MERTTDIYIYMVAPPQGPPEREGMYHLPSVVLNTFKDMGGLAYIYIYMILEDVFLYHNNLRFMK